MSDETGHLYAEAVVRLRRFLEAESALDHPQVRGPMALLQDARARRRWCPVPGRHVASGMHVAAAAARQLRETLPASWPETGSMLDDVVDAAGFVLEESVGTALLDALRQERARYPDALVSLPRDVPEVDWTDLVGTGVVPAREALSPTGRGGVILLGPSWMWKPSQFTAPLSPLTVLVRPSWTRDEIPDWRLFEPLAGVVFSGSGPVVTYREDRGSGGSVEGMPAPAASTEAQIEGLTRFVSSTYEQGSGRHDQVAAYPILLAGNRVAFARRDSSVFVVDLTGARVELKKVPAAEVEPDQFIVLRTREAEDLIRVEADRQLGEGAPGLRALESRWKAIVKRATETHGLHKTCALLRTHGAGLATPGNVVRWAYGDTVAPREDADLRAVLRMEGQDADTALIRAAATRIYRAHQSAGHAIRGQLNESIRTLQSSDLIGQTERRFEIAGGGELTAILVHQRLPSTVNVGYDTLNLAIPAPALTSSHDFT